MSILREIVEDDCILFQQCQKPRARPFERCKRCHVKGHFAKVSSIFMRHLTANVVRVKDVKQKEKCHRQRNRHLP